MVLSSTSCPIRARTRSLDLGRCRYLAPFSAGKEGSQEAFLFCQHQVLMATTSLARGFDGLDPKPIVVGDELVNCRLGNPTMLGDLLGWPRVNQGIVDDEPTPSAPGPGVIFQSALDFFEREMSGCAGDSCHNFPLF